jgi:hypothetical protein
MIPFIKLKECNEHKYYLAVNDDIMHYESNSCKNQTDKG